MAGLKTSNLNSHVIATVFDSNDLSFLQRDCKLEDLKPFSEDPLESYWGTTPLYDAINAMGRHLKDLDPARASVVIVTDGEDTGSATTIHQAKGVLDWMKAKGWAVTFIGCDFNNSRQALALGINPSAMIGVQKTLLTDAAKSLATKRTHHYHTGEDPHFSDSEKSQFGGYLSAK